MSHVAGLKLARARTLSRAGSACDRNRERLGLGAGQRERVWLDPRSLFGGDWVGIRGFLTGGAGVSEHEIHDPGGMGRSPRLE